MEQRRRRRGGCCGCGIALLVAVLLLGVWITAIRWGALERLGLRQPVQERVFAPPPNREASTAIMNALEQAGMNTQGVEFWVLPMAGPEGGSVAILTLDASKGFDLEQLFSEANLRATGEVAEGPTLEDMNITRLAFDYVDQSGKSIVMLTVSTEALRQFSQEEIDEKEFLRAVMGNIDIPALIREMTP